MLFLHGYLFHNKQHLFGRKFMHGVFYRFFKICKLIHVYGL
ncbi:hypothetical protein HMPREF3182_00110 [Megasphaera hutchinsoni]|uniref:Uncharacterized protein n=1 Tax=Megasphaera hutchinsoni TaxID=1588748 RepID=A0A134CLV2_9FIRM|nr:hypothetical protein HMPREF3182_00110 [Megasphaera hutchinsoni]